MLEQSLGIGKACMEMVLGALPSALLSAMIWMLVGVVLVAVLHRRRVYARSVPLWNVLAKLHYPLWLAIFALFGFSFGLVNSLKGSVFAAIDGQLRPALTEVLPPLQQKLMENLPAELANQPLTGEAIYEYFLSLPRAGEELEKEAASWRGRVSQRFRQWTDDYLYRRSVQAMAEAMARQAALQMGLEEDAVIDGLAALKSVDLTDQAGAIAGAITDALKGQVGGAAVALQIQAAAGLLLMSLLLLVEPTAHWAWQKNRIRRAAIAPAATQ